MNNIFLVHGSFGKPFENWFPWLEGELSNSKKATCFVPHFPTPEKQSFENWSRILDSYRDLGLIDNTSVLVGHSLGSIFLARYILDRQVQVKAYVSVSGYNNFLAGLAGLEIFDEVNKRFFIDDKKLHGLKTWVGVRHCFISDNDPYLPLTKLNEFADLIQGDVHLVKQGGHFNANAGYAVFPALLELLLGLVR